LRYQQVKTKAVKAPADEAGEAVPIKTKAAKAPKVKPVRF